MTYVLFATSRFGALTLAALSAAGFPPVALVTNPDRPAGRKQQLTPTPAKEKARELGIPVIEPERLADAYDELRALSADVFVVASFGKILRPDLLAIPRRGVVGIHPSLLPRYRGPAPIQQAVIDGVTETGVTLFVVDDQVDHGPMLGVRTLAVEDGEGNLSLEARLAEVGAALAAELLPQFVAGSLALVEQDHAAATFTQKFSTQDGYVPWDDVHAAYEGNRELAVAIRDRIGGLCPEPGAWTEFEGTRIKLLAAELQDGLLRVTRYQKAGKNVVEGLLKI